MSKDVAPHRAIAATAKVELEANAANIFEFQIIDPDVGTLHVETGLGIAGRLKVNHWPVTWGNDPFAQWVGFDGLVYSTCR